MMISIGLMIELMIYWVLHGPMMLASLKIPFDDDLFKDNWFEGKPELFLVVRDPSGKILHKTPPQIPTNPNDTEKLNFTITIPKPDCFTESPYDSVNGRRMAAFVQIGDSINLTDNIRNSSQLLIQSMNAWLLYTNEVKWNLIGYDGPQVERLSVA